MNPKLRGCKDRDEVPCIAVHSAVCEGGVNIRKCRETSSQGTKLCCPEWIRGSGMVREGEGRMQLHSNTQDVSSLRKVPMLSLSEKLIFTI